MNRNLIIVAVVVLITLVGGGYFLMNRSDNSETPSQTASEASSAPETAESMQKTTLKEFMAMSGTQQCQFNDAETGNSGAVFIDAGKMRGDFNSSVNGKITPSHMINDGKDIYFWMDDQATGFKTSLSAIEGMSGHTGSAQTVDINKEVDYKCESWTADPVKFAVPTEVKFQDMAAMMNNMTNSAAPNVPNGGNMEAACAACDNLQGSQRDQCRTALKCN